MEIIRSIYELLGPTVQPNTDESDIQRHADEIIEVREILFDLPLIVSLSLSLTRILIQRILNK